MKAVSYDRNGDVDVLDVVEVPDPVPGEREVLVLRHRRVAKLARQLAVFS